MYFYMSTAKPLRGRSAPLIWHDEDPPPSLMSRSSPNGSRWTLRHLLVSVGNYSEMSAAGPQLKYNINTLCGGFTVCITRPVKKNFNLTDQL